MGYMGSGRSGTFEWLFQRVSGVALLIILAIHFVLLHYTGDGPVTYQKVAPRLANPAYKAMDLLFLVLALYHGMTGVKLVIDDYLHHKGLRLLAVGLLWVVCLGFLIFGAITILTFTVRP